MIGGLNGHLGEDDYSEPLEILINSANKNNKFNLFDFEKSLISMKLISNWLNDEII